MALRHNRPSPLVRSCAHFAVESLERRCLLSTASTTDAALIAGWNSMSAAARHAIAVVEYVNPDFHAALDADLASLGLDPIPAVPGSLPDPAFGKSKHHHARPHKTFLYHAKPKRHHSKDGPAAPTVSAAFYYDTLPNQLTFTFDQDVSSPDWNAALTLIDLNTGATVPATGVYSTQSVVYTLNNSGTLPNANFAAILHGSLVSSTSTGLHLAGSDSTPGDDFSTPFFFANADVNRDRVVNLGDVNVISSHFNAHPATFTQGDANFDTSVNIGDVNLVSQLYNTDFPLLTSPSAPTATPISANSVSLSWPDVPGIDSYDLYRFDPSGTLQCLTHRNLWMKAA